MSDAFLAIRELLATVLKEEPVDALGADCWGSLLANNKLFEQELAACRNTLDAIQWKTAGALAASHEFACQNCASKLVKQLDTDNTDQELAQYMCSACGNENEAVPLLGFGIEEAYGFEAHLAAKDGGEPPVGTCPECGEETYVISEGGCAICGFEMPDDATCAVCGEKLTLDDLGEVTGLCGYHRYVAQKDD